MKQKFFKTLRRFAAGATVLCAVLLASCSNLIEEEHIKVVPQKPVEQPVKAGEKVKVKLIVADTARSAYPAIPCKEFDSFMLKCDGTVIEQWVYDADQKLTAYEMLSKAEVELTTGVHTLELTGSVSGGTLYKDEVTTTVTAGMPLTFNLSLAKFGTGTGYFTWNLSLSSYTGATVTRITCDLYKTEDGVTHEAAAVGTQQVVSNSSGLSAWSVTTSPWNIRAGKYIAVYNFYTSNYSNSYGEFVGSWEDVVGIVGGRTTNYVQSITELNKRYTVTYYINGGSGDSYRYYTTQNDVTLQIPSKSNRTFAGWYTTEDFTGEPVTGWEKRTHAGDISLYAKWTYDITFDMNGTTEAPVEGSVNKMTLLEGASVTLPVAGFTREGYAFKGWNTNAAGTGTAYDPGSTFSSTVHTTLYAQWMERAEDEAAVSYVVNGGNRIDMQIVESGATLTQPECSRTGYNLTGWFASADGGVTLSDTAFVFGEDGDTVTEDTVLYAVWAPKVFTITYYDADPTLTDKEFSGTHADGYPAVHTYGTATTLDAPEAADSDSSFIGWYTSSTGSGTAVTEFGAEAYTESVPALYARYLQTKFHVSEDGDDTEGTGKADAPFATISKAVDAITAQNTKTDYRIIVHGTVASNYTLGIDTGYAFSITIEGADGSETDALDGSSAGTVLFINTSVPVTLKNIKVTNGYTSSTWYGGGITLRSGNLTLAEGTLITGNKSMYIYYSNWTGTSFACGGGGVFVNTGSVTMEEGAEISNNTAGTVGGGVFISGCYGAAAFTMNGGTIKNNTVTASNTNSSLYFGGGGVYLYGYTDNCSFTMNGGEITGNSVPDATSFSNGGGGVYVYSYRSTTSFIMNGGKISGNTSALGSGLYNSRNSTINDGEIDGVYNAYTLTMKGGEITGTVRSDSNFIMSGGTAAFVTSDSYFAMSGTAHADLVKLRSSSYGITVTDELTGETPVATITPYSYSAGQKLIYAGSGVTLTQEIVDKFALTGDGTPWYISFESDGAYLRRTVYNITYKGKNGADFTGTLPEGAKVTHTYGTSTTLPVPEREGYAFQGWHKLADCSDQPVKTIGAAEITADITLYTYWTHEAVNFEINNSSIAITKTEADDGTVTLTASAPYGYKDFVWDVDGETPATVITGASVSADGKAITFNKANIMKGLTYVISINAKNQNGLEDRASVTVKKEAE